MKNPAIRDAEEFKLLNRLYDYLVSKTTADVLACVLEMSAFRDCVYNLTLYVPNVRSKFFHAVILKELRLMFPRIFNVTTSDARWNESIGFETWVEMDMPPEEKKYIPKPYDPFREHASVIIGLDDSVIGDLFYNSNLDQVYKRLGPRLTRVFLDYFDHQKLEPVIKSYTVK